MITMATLYSRYAEHEAPRDHNLLPSLLFYFSITSVRCRTDCFLLEWHRASAEIVKRSAIPFTEFWELRNA